MVLCSTINLTILNAKDIQIDWIYEDLWAYIKHIFAMVLHFCSSRDKYLVYRFAFYIIKDVLIYVCEMSECVIMDMIEFNKLW